MMEIIALFTSTSSYRRPFRRSFKRWMAASQHHKVDKTTIFWSNAIADATHPVGWSVFNEKPSHDQI